MSKFFFSKDQISNEVVTLTGQDVDHIVRVLRHVPGDELTLCDGEGFDYRVFIKEIDKRELKAKILKKYPCLNEPKTRVVLYQGLPKQGKMEWIIEKCTELGVSAIVPVETVRSVVRLHDGQAEKKLERWQKTAVEAAKQCGRGRVPQIFPPVKLMNLTQAELPEFLLLPYEEETTVPARAALSEIRANTAGIFIGPEGGFDPEEARYLIGLGAKSVTLGRRILRTETAGMTALSLLLYEWDEMQCE